MHEPRPGGSSAGAVASRRDEQPLDDWLGDVSDDDWDEPGTAPAPRPPAGDSQRLAVATGDDTPDRTSTRATDAADAHRAVIERRRFVAALVALVLVGLGAATSVLLLRGGGGETAVTSVSPPAATTPAPSEPTTTSTTTPPPTTATTPSTTPTATTPSTTPTATTPSATTTTPSTSTASTFTLPEGTKLQQGADGDPTLIKELQEALVTAGYDPGTPDGVFGPQTEAAVVAFQQANGLSVDGRVGPETAAALSSALASG